MIGKKFKNIKNGLVVTVVAQDDVRKTVQVEYEDGKTKDMSMSTMKRWWKKLDEEDKYVQEVMEQKKELGIECPPIENYEVVNQDEKKTAAKAKKQRVKTKTPNSEVPGIVEFIDETAKAAGINFYVRDKQPGFKNYRFDEGKVLFTVRIVRHQVEINCKSRDISTELANSMDFMNGFFDRRIIIKTLDDNRDVIVKIIETYHKKEEK